MPNNDNPWLSALRGLFSPLPALPRPVAMNPYIANGVSVPSWEAMSDYLNSRLNHVDVPSQGSYQPLSSHTQQQLPVFLQQKIQSGAMPLPTMGTSNPRDSVRAAIAHVMSGTSGILVDQPDQFNSPVLSHETVHVLQNAQTHPTPVVQNQYEYGGAAGLLKARAAGKTMGDFSQEQQAQMVQDYMKAHIALRIGANAPGGISPSDAAKFESLKAAYEPFVRELAQAETRTTRQPGIPLYQAQTPGLPPSSITGFVEPSKFMMASPPVRVGQQF